MGRKNKYVVYLKPFCYYCDKEFNNESILHQHQKSKHFNCKDCRKRFSTAPAIENHAIQVHKTVLKAVENAKAGRDGFELSVYGMDGVPMELINFKIEERINQKKRRLVKEGDIKIDSLDSNFKVKDSNNITYKSKNGNKIAALKHNAMSNNMNMSMNSGPNNQIVKSTEMFYRNPDSINITRLQQRPNGNPLLNMNMNINMNAVPNMNMNGQNINQLNQMNLIAQMQYQQMQLQMAGRVGVGGAQVPFNFNQNNIPNTNTNVIGNTNTNISTNVIGNTNKPPEVNNQPNLNNGINNNMLNNINQVNQVNQIKFQPNFYQNMQGYNYNQMNNIRQQVPMNYSNTNINGTINNNQGVNNIAPPKFNIPLPSSNIPIPTPQDNNPFPKSNDNELNDKVNKVNQMYNFQ